MALLPQHITATKKSDEEKAAQLFNLRALEPTKAQQFQESSSFTLPTATQQIRQEAIDVTWQLRLISFDGISKNNEKPDSAPPVSDPAIAAYGVDLTKTNDLTPDTAEESPVWLAKSPLWLFIQATPTLEGSYFYAPFATGQNNDEIKASSEAILPTEFEFFTASGEAIKDVAVFYPPGEIKKDYFSGLDLPSYPNGALILANFPVRLAGQEITVKLSALVCTESSCTPFRKSYGLSFDSSSILTALPDKDVASAFYQYRSEPFYAPGQRTVEQPQPVETAGQESFDTVNEQPGFEGGLADYIENLQPRYHHESLEVSTLGRAIILGLIAGLILNFMPCVLPVITLKIGTLLGLGGWSRLKGDELAARHGRRRFRIYAFCFSLGIFVWFGMLFAVIGLAGFLWGQFFQSQTLVMALAFLLFFMALSLLGILRLPVLHANMNSHAPLHYQAFLGGLLATLLATPCSGPLLGGVLGWAVNQSLPYLGITLASVAVGMASPFLLMVIRPDIARLLPKPGPWTRKLEVVMSFVLFGTVIYLLGMLPQDRLFPILSALLAVAFSAWLWSQGKKERGMSFSRLLAVILATGAIYLSFTHQPVDTRWKNFETAHFNEQIGEHNILIDFTADWCINCRAMEMTTLTEQNLATWGKKYDLLYIQVDLTGPNPEGEALLAAMGSASIPVLAIIPASSPLTPTVLRDIVTSAQLESALKAAINNGL